MKIFYHHDAKTLDEAVSLLQQYEGKARVIAGGTDVISGLQARLYPELPEALVNIKTIPDLDYIKEEGGVLKIGALTTLYDIYTNGTVADKYKALAQAAHAVGSPELRNMGTIGGNLCQHLRCWYYRLDYNAFHCLRKGGVVCYGIAGDNRYLSIFGGPEGCYGVCPSDTAPALVALNASVVTTERTIPIEEFFSNLEPGHVLGPSEILTEIQVPAPGDSKQAFLKSAVRKTFDFALASAAAVISPATGAVSSARIAIGSVAPTPLRATAAEEALIGKTITTSVAESAASAAVEGAVPLSMNKYKVQIAKTLVKRAILA
ncbi:MAG: FAD binding domain-containing protein [Candidatus Bathyarchaeia archaeon]